MKTKEVTVGTTSLTLKELTYLDVVELAAYTETRKRVEKLLSLSGVPESVIPTLTMSEGSQINQAINELNGWTEGFRQTS